MTENKEVMTVSYNETIKGWTSFHSFFPDLMLGMNNEFYSFSNGDLFKHNSDNVPRNNFYGVQYDSKLSVMVNQTPSTIKELKNISLEGNKPWGVKLKAYVRDLGDFKESTIQTSEFVVKEGIWHAYVRRDENPNQLDSKSAYGIGTVSNITGNTVTLFGGSSFITNGDVIANDSMTVLGEIVSSNIDGNAITLVLTSTVGINVGNFLLGVKDARIEGGNLRGYTIRVDLTNTDVDKVELFAVNAEISKSFP